MMCRLHLLNNKNMANELIKQRVTTPPIALLERRRAMMFSRTVEQYVINSVDNPKIMAQLYSKGLCASPDGMTKKECAAVSPSSFSIRTSMGEPFDAFQYFTQFINIPINHFYGAGFTHIVFPPNIKTFASDCFRYCGFKGTIVIPESVTSIGQRALSPSYSSSATYIMEGETPPIVRAGNFASAKMIYVPDDSLDAYISALNGIVSSSKVKPISEYSS